METIKDWFRHSLTVFWARLQVLGGVVLGAFLLVDAALFQPLIPTKYFGVWLVLTGVLTEMARRRTLDK